MTRVEDMLQKMIKRLDASDEHAKVFRGHLANIGQKVDAHTIKPCKPGTVPSNTIQNAKNVVTVHGSHYFGS